MRDACHYVSAKAPAVTETTTIHYPPAVSPEPLDHAVLRAVAYADVFDYPLRATEIHRYLHGVSAGWAATTTAIERSVAPGGSLSCQDGCYTLRGREHLVNLRRRRATNATRLWPSAVWYGSLMARLPFVRMVAVTGSLAWDNVEDRGDIDYLVVTEAQRLWVCRLFLAAMVRIARRSGVPLCINYVISERVLALAERDLYTAYELVQMRPVSGLAVYQQMRLLNAWTGFHLPNAVESPPVPATEARPPPGRLAQLLVFGARLGEWVLRSWVGATLEWIERKYRIRKIRLSVMPCDEHEVSFGPDCFKAHANGYRRAYLAGFVERLHRLDPKKAS